MADLDKLEKKAQKDFAKLSKDLDKDVVENKSAINKIKQLADQLKKLKD